MSAYLRSAYSQRVLGKWKPFELTRMHRRASRVTPGWTGDPDQRRFRFAKWVKRPDTAKALYHRIRGER